MNDQTHGVDLCLRLMLTLLVIDTVPAVAEFQIVESFVHVRNVKQREWSHFPERAAASGLIRSFDLDRSKTYRLLTLRQAEVRQTWVVTLNGVALGQLEKDHNDLELALQVPPRLLKPEANTLEIRTSSSEPDDIRVGEVTLHRMTRGELTGAATVSVVVTDAETGAPLPCRLTIARHDNQSLALLGAESDDRLAVRTGIIYTLDGRAQFTLREGRHRLWAGRGFEYGIADTELDVAPGQGIQTIALALRREVPTPGLVACDTHLHTNEFARHGDATLIERLITLAGEGIELPISTEHDQHIDYAPEAERIGAARHFTSILGCEVTTREGHFNSFPIDRESRPAQHRLRPWPQVFRNIYGTPGVRITILNHARDIHAGFRPFGAEQFDPASGQFLDGRKLEANGLELINSGAQQTDPMRLVRDWFALLKSGHRIAGVGSSDSHTVNFAIAGQARTYLTCPDDNPGNIDVAKAVDSFLSGSTHVSFGLLTLLDFTGKDRVTARVLGPAWTQATALTLFANGESARKVAIPVEASRVAGLKWQQTWRLAELDLDPGAKTFLVAVAEGPGITAPWWPIMPPYQPDSTDFKPFVMGVSPAIWVADDK